MNRPPSVLQQRADHGAPQDHELPETQRPRCTNGNRTCEPLNVENVDHGSAARGNRLAKPCGKKGKLRWKDPSAAGTTLAYDSPKLASTAPPESPQPQKRRSSAPCDHYDFIYASICSLASCGPEKTLISHWMSPFKNTPGFLEGCPSRRLSTTPFLSIEAFAPDNTINHLGAMLHIFQEKILPCLL